MRGRNLIEWTAFAGGIVLALAVWGALHPERGNGSSQADKPAAYSVSVIDETPSEPSRSAGGGETQQPNRAPGRIKHPGQPPTTVTPPQVNVRVYLTEQRRIEKVPLETYVRGVVAAEMPASFDLAAQEAQALAARTYIVRRLLLHDLSGVPAAGADVTDTETHQVYRSIAEMNRLRTDNETAWRTAENAAKRTKGQIIVYDGQPIQALYFSTSNGYTENSEEVFPGELPYLRSVASPWDRHNSPRSVETMEMPLREFYSKLGVRVIPVAAQIAGYPKIKIIEKTQGNRVKKLTVGGKSFTGVEIREKLGLRSASFTWTAKGNTIRITTYGSGHGVGLSQWGAEGMAKAGYTADQIAAHYYPGTGLMEVSKLADLFE